MRKHLEEDLTGMPLAESSKRARDEKHISHARPEAALEPPSKA